MISLCRPWRCVKLSEARGCHVVSGRRKSTLGCFAQCSADRKRTHIGTKLLILQFCMNFGPYLRKLKVRLSKTRPLCLQSVKRRLEQGPRWLVVALFVFGVHFFCQLVVSVRSGCNLQLRRGRSVAAPNNPSGRT